MQLNMKIYSHNYIFLKHTKSVSVIDGSSKGLLSLSGFLNVKNINNKHIHCITKYNRMHVNIVLSDWEYSYPYLMQHLPIKVFKDFISQTFQQLYSLFISGVSNRQQAHRHYIIIHNKNSY